MKLIEETYRKCPICGVEARGIVDLNRVFGYWFEGEEIDLHEQCKACRGVNEFEETPAQERVARRWRKDWDTAACWARKIHISGAKFTSSLVELEYLEAEAKSDLENQGAGAVFRITSKGYEHCRIKQTPLGDVVQWDFDTFAEVACLRARMAL